MPKPPLTREQILDQLRRVTDEGYYPQFFDEPGAICQYRGWARASAELAKVGSRSATRQFFISPPGFEAAGPPSRASSSITLRRSIDLDRTLIAMAGTLSFAGPNGRVYRTTEDLVWYSVPDPNAERAAFVECDLLGEPGNLEWYADDDGNLTHPVTGEPQTSVLDIEELSQGRAGLKATLDLAGATGTELVDNGAAPTFAPTDVGLHVQINHAGDSANVGRVVRIIGWSISDTAGEDGFYPRTITIDDGPQPALTSSALLDDGGVITDYTAAAQSGVDDAVQLLPDVPVVGDRFFFGGDAPFGVLELLITQRRYGDLTLVYEWWDGAVYQPAADLVDGSEAFAIEGVSTITHTIDAGWTMQTIGARTAYFLAARVDTFTSQALPPLASRLVTYAPNPLVADPLDSNGDGQIGWSILDYRDLGLVIVEMPAPAGGRDDDLGLKLAEREIRQRPAESLELLRRRASRFPDVVTPERITWEINRILEPLGLAGAVIDPGHGHTGLFWDVPVSSAPAVVGAWDMYAPGDLFPSDLTMVQLDEHEARWHFFVQVSPSGLGEFGCAWDDGPPAFYAEAYEYFLGPAWDFGFCDGYPAVAAAAYKAVWERVNEARAGGIAFTMTLADLPVCP